MYSRGYDRGIESDGMLKEYERSYEENQMAPPPAEEALAHSPHKSGKKKLFGGIDTEDLLILAIALLILMDGEPDNDLILIALAVLLFF